MDYGLGGGFGLFGLWIELVLVVDNLDRDSGCRLGVGVRPRRREDGSMLHVYELCKNGLQAERWTLVRFVPTGGLLQS